MAMKGKPSIDDFLEGGKADKAPANNPSAIDAKAAPTPIKPEPTVQKLFRLRWDTAQALKLGAVHQSTAQGRRITETEIVEELIREHFGLDSKPSR